MINIDLIDVLDSSSLLLGHYDGQAPPSFITVNLLYIDLLKRITQIDSILKEKYCDIDAQFGLHDYTVSIEMRN